MHIQQNAGMLVDVVLMRIRGEPRRRADVQASVPVRGVLQLDHVRPGWHRGQRDAPLLAGLVVPGGSEWALPPLDQARITRIRGPNLYIVGIEEITRDRRTVLTFRQAWWCRLVLDGGAIASAAAAFRAVDQRAKVRQMEPA